MCGYQVGWKHLKAWASGGECLTFGKMEMHMTSLRRLVRRAFGSLLRPSAERTEVFVDPLEIPAGAEVEPGQSVRPSGPKDALGVFRVRLMVHHLAARSLKIFPTSNLKAEISHSDYMITLRDDGSAVLILHATPPPQAEEILRAYGLNSEDRKRHGWALSPPKKPWSAMELITLIGSLQRFTRVDPHFWDRASRDEVEEEPIKPVSEGKVEVDGPITRREIAWRPGGIDKDRDEVVWLDVAKFDELWRGDIHYIERHPDAEKGLYDRYPNAGNWIMAGNDVDMPFLCGDEYFASNGAASFGDGTHRFSWVRDHGARAIPVVMNKDDCAEIKRRCGTDERICQVTYSTQDAAEAVKDMNWQDKRAKVNAFFETAAMLRDQIDEAARGGDVFPLAKPDPKDCRVAVTAIEAMVESLTNIGPLRERAELFRRCEPTDEVD
jgi:hypothetical protein